MDDFGRAVAVDGRTLAVGAPRKHDGAGAVYVFTRTTETAPWTHDATLAPPVSGRAP